jgi:hypothetical protein
MEVYQELKEAAIEIGLHINSSKSKEMIMSCSKVNTGHCLNIGGHNFELVNSSVYILSCITHDDNAVSETQRRLIQANSAYCSVPTVMRIRFLCSLLK